MDLNSNIEIHKSLISFMIGKTNHHLNSNIEIHKFKGKYAY